MATYPPNFSDTGTVQLCLSVGNPVNVDGFYKAINSATGNTNGSIDDVWKLYITNVLGRTFVGSSPTHYGLSYGDALVTPVYNFVVFGGGGTLDSLAIAADAGFLSATTSFRAIVRFKPTKAHASLVGTQETLLHIGASTATQYVRLQRNKSNGRLQLALGSGTISTTTVSSRTYSVGEEVVALLSYDGDANWWEESNVPATCGKAMASIYIGGVLVDTIYAGGIPPASLSLQSATELSIGAAISTYTSATTLFAESQYGEVRIWASDGDTAIKIRGPHASYLSKDALTPPTLAGESTLTDVSAEWDALAAGVAVSFDDAFTQFSAEILSTNPTARTITFSTPFPRQVTFSDTMLVAATSAEAHVAEAISASPSVSGTIAGRSPLVYFGGTQTAAQWNAADNHRGTLNGFGAVVVE